MSDACGGQAERQRETDGRAREPVKRAPRAQEYRQAGKPAAAIGKASDGHDQTSVHAGSKTPSERQTYLLSRESSSSQRAYASSSAFFSASSRASAA